MSLLTELYDGKFIPKVLSTCYDERISDADSDMDDIAKSLVESGANERLVARYKLAYQDAAYLLVLKGFEQGFKCAAKLIGTAFGD